MPLTLLDLLNLANEAYGDDGLAGYYDHKTGALARMDNVRFEVSRIKVDLVEILTP